MSFFGKSSSSAGGLAAQQASLPSSASVNGQAGTVLTSQGLYGSTFGQPYYGGISTGWTPAPLGTTMIKNFSVSMIENVYIIQFGSKQYVTMNEFCDVGSFINDLIEKDKATHLLK